ncbi:MAG: LamG-like jellyroll fold domain-containing protein [Halovenus sp.]
MQRVIHEAEKHDGPVLEPTEPWEMGLGTEDNPGNAYVNGTVIYDEDEQLFKMWYQTFWVEGDFENFGYYVCYAISEDGVEWEKPDLGIFEYDGSRDNNIVYDSPLHPPSVIKDSPAESTYVSSGAGAGLFSSPDGLNWSPSGSRLPSVSGGPDSVATQFDPVAGKFVSLFRGLREIRGQRRRTIYRSLSDDFETWSEPQEVLPPAERDDELARESGNEYAGTYRMPMISYDGVYVGFPSVIFVGGGNTEEIIMQLAFSRDLKRWVREDHTSKIPLGDDGEFDSGMLFGATHGSDVLAVDDEVRVYYGGWDGGHATTERGAAVGLAKWRLDGFASLTNDGDSTGTVTTEVVQFEDDQLHVNADLENAAGKNGRLDVEVLDADGNVIDGFERENCVTIRGDEVDRKVNWLGPTNLGSLTGEEIRFRLYLEDGDVYSLQFDYERIQYTVDVSIEDEDANPIEGAAVTVDTIDERSATSDSDGTVSFELVNGEYTISASAEGFLDGSEEITVDGGDEAVTLTLEAEKTEPVGHYRLDTIQDDGTVLDASPSGNDGTNNGATVVDGVVGNALELAGEGVWVDIPDDPSLGVEHVTIATWVSPEPSERSYIFDGRGHEYFLDEFRTASGEPSERPEFGVSVGNTFYGCVAPEASVPDSEWYHVAGTYDGSEMRLYIDGELVQTNDAPSGPIDVSPGPARIGNFTGAEDDSRDWTYDGAIDDLYVYNRALSQGAIQDLIGRAPVAHYRLDTIQDDGTVLDASPSGNDGTNNGATVVDGVVDDALAFQGESIWVDVPDDPSLGVENVTIAAWVNPDSSSDPRYVFDGRGHEYLLDLRGADRRRPQLFLFVGGDFYRCIAPPGSVPDSGWYHVAGTYDGSEMRVYVDGESVQTNAKPSGPIDVSSGPARVGNFTGAEENSDDWTFDGVIDDLYVYDRALSNEEIDLLLARER